MFARQTQIKKAEKRVQTTFYGLSGGLLIRTRRAIIFAPKAAPTPPIYIAEKRHATFTRNLFGVFFNLQLN